MPQDPTNPSSPELLLETPRFRVERLSYRDAQGQRRSKDVIRHPGAVVVLPVLDDGRICLIRNCRITVGETLWEAPAGTLDPPESPANCAARELQEETGYLAGRMDSLGWFYLSPGIIDERMHLFIAAELTAGKANRMADEQIENAVVTYDDALAMIRDGTIHDAKTIVALLRFGEWTY